MEYHSGGSLPLLGRPRYCPGANANGGYLCETGQCCGESGCCTYYYELWWFWLLWTALILFSCCCAYRHRRAKLRLQQQQRQRDISLLAYQGASSFPSSMLDLSFLASLKLPSYEEVAAQPSTPPPPYSSVFTAARYPQPPRAAHPHLLSQHPGAPQHPPQHPGARPLQPLSDGLSSLSSDNSSSCSCDSCCPSSPCSSSLSAPVTYETDTSHASTPSEAAPLALDSVTVETMSAAAARLAPKDTVTFLIERTDPAAAAETKAPTDLDVALPVGITPPIKQQLDVTEASANLDRTLDDTSLTPPRTLSLILDSVGGSADTNPSLVPISASPQNPPRASPTGSKTELTLPQMSPNTQESPNVTDPSSPSQGTAHFSNKPAGESSELTAEAPDAVKQNEEARNVRESPTTSQAPDEENPRGEHTTELSISIGTAAVNPDTTDTTAPVNSSLSPTPQSSTPEPIVSRLDAKTEPPGSVSISTPDPTNSEGSAVLSPDGVAIDDRGETETPPLKPRPTTKADSLDAASPTLDRETGRQSNRGVEVDSKLLNLEKPSTGLTQDQTYPESPESVTIPMPRPSVSKESGSRENVTSQFTTNPSAQPTAEADSLDLTFHRETGIVDVETNSSEADSKVLNSDRSLTKSTRDPTYLESPAEPPELRTTPPEPPRVSVSIPEPSLQFYAGLPPSTPRPAAKAGSLNVLSPTLDLEMGRRSTANLGDETNSSKADSKVLNSEQSLTKSTQDPTYLESPAFVELCTTAPELPRVSMSIPDPRDPSLKLYAESPPRPTANASSLNVLSPTFDLEMGKLNLEVERCCSQSLLADSKLRNLDQSPDACLFFPAITIHADPPSFAASPCSIPSPSQSPPPASMLLLDPLAALQPPDRSASASSGHASSLSPSPRNTQSPPKQTLFSPCVDVFEPVVDPDWEDEESEGPADEEYCEDSDVAADESQYRHRRLTGDSGIEVCRCHVEDEDGDMEKKKPDERKCAGGAALHDSADCPVRSRGSSDDDAGLCETSPDEVVIPVETV